VKDVAVIGLPDQRLGEIVAAVIELKPGMSVLEKEIEQFCGALPRYKRPRKIFFEKFPVIQPVKLKNQSFARDIMEEVL